MARGHEAAVIWKAGMGAAEALSALKLACSASVDEEEAERRDVALKASSNGVDRTEVFGVPETMPVKEGSAAGPLRRLAAQLSRLGCALSSTRRGVLMRAASRHRALAALSGLDRLAESVRGELTRRAESRSRGLAAASASRDPRRRARGVLTDASRLKWSAVPGSLGLAYTAEARLADGASLELVVSVDGRCSGAVRLADGTERLFTTRVPAQRNALGQAVAMEAGGEALGRAMQAALDAGLAARDAVEGRDGASELAESSLDAALAQLGRVSEPVADVEAFAAEAVDRLEEERPREAARAVELAAAERLRELEDLAARQKEQMTRAQEKALWRALDSGALTRPELDAALADGSAGAAEAVLEEAGLDPNPMEEADARALTGAAAVLAAVTCALESGENVERAKRRQQEAAQERSGAAL